MKRIFALCLPVVFLAVSCKKANQPAEENDNELITTVELQFTKKSDGSASVFMWEDVDGPGGEIPYADTLLLQTNEEYDVKITVWNKSRTPAENITEEVTAESENHRFYYEPSANMGITVSNFDNDINGMPLGVNSRWVTTNAAEGTAIVVLRHYPEGGKAADDLLNSPKSTTDAGAVFIAMVKD